MTRNTAEKSQYDKDHSGNVEQYNSHRENGTLCHLKEYGDGGDGNDSNDNYDDANDDDVNYNECC